MGAFTPQYPLESVPLWIATKGDAAAASAACATSFTGAPVQMVQFVDGSGGDADLVCGEPAAAELGPPASLTVRPAVSKGVELT